MENISWCVFFTLQAKDELNETEERRASTLKELRAVMKERAAEGDDLAKLVLERFGDKPDSLLLRFLRARKFEVVRSYELLRGKYDLSSIYIGIDYYSSSIYILESMTGLLEMHINAHINYGIHMFRFSP